MADMIARSFRNLDTDILQYAGYSMDQTARLSSQFYDSSSQPNTLGFDVSLLSSNTYTEPQTVQNQTVNDVPRRSRGLLAGLLLEENVEDSQQQSKPTSTKRVTMKRKGRQSSTSDDDDEATRARGRPRLETQDETAADRRRTQIRLAQRAYRTRKENAITTLTKRVNELAASIGELSTAFLNIQGDMAESGILSNRPDISYQLNMAVANIVALAKTGKGSTSDMENEGAEPKSNETSITSLPQSNSGQIKTVSFEDEVEEILRGQSHIHVQSPNFQQVSLPSGQTVQIPTATAHSTQIFNQYFEADQAQQIDFQVDRPLNAPDLPYTYSFQETTFSRRLHRMCLEKGFRLLTAPDTHPDELARTFRFSFCLSSKKRVILRFQDLLKRGTDQALENWYVPFFYIGGAGTHFPRRDSEGQPIYPPNMLHPNKAFGPFPFVPPSEIETPIEKGSGSIDEILEAIGFGGTWFDSWDVEQYLRSKGIELEGNSSFVDVSPSVLSKLLPGAVSGLSVPALSFDNSTGSSPLALSISSPKSIHRSATASPASTNFTAALYPDLVQDHARSLFSAHENLDLSVLLPPTPKGPTKQLPDGSEQDALWPMPYGCDGMTGLLTQKAHPEQQPPPNIVMDVDKFLTRLLQDAACLGRAPGFRQETVDNALLMALTEGF